MQVVAEVQVEQEFGQSIAISREYKQMLTLASSILIVLVAWTSLAGSVIEHRVAWTGSAST